MEKRKHRRFPSRLSLKYRLLKDSPPKLRQAQSIDMSNGGMSFRNSEFIPHQSPVLVEFESPNMHHPLRFVSEVVHTREHLEEDHFIISVEFQQLLK
jgi:c-di-GMP-binding flagellar brake protein YcgR